MVKIEDLTLTQPELSWNVLSDLNKLKTETNVKGSQELLTFHLLK